MSCVEQHGSSIWCHQDAEPRSKANNYLGPYSLEDGLSNLQPLGRDAGRRPLARTKRVGALRLPMDWSAHVAVAVVQASHSINPLTARALQLLVFLRSHPLVAAFHRIDPLIARPLAGLLRRRSPITAFHRINPLVTRPPVGLCNVSALPRSNGCDYAGDCLMKLRFIRGGLPRVLRVNFYSPRYHARKPPFLDIEHGHTKE